MATKPFSMMQETATPLYMLAFMMGHESREVRAAGIMSMLHAAAEVALAMESLKHLETCSDCAGRVSMHNYVMEMAGKS